MKLTIVVDLNNQKVTVEGEGSERALTEITKNLTLHLAPSKSKRKQSTSSESLRQFVQRFHPKNNSERIAILAYFSQHNEQRDIFSAKDMKVWFHACGYSMPQQMSVALAWAKEERYVEMVKWSRWALSAYGKKAVEAWLEK